MDQQHVEAILRRTTLRQVEVILALRKHGSMTRAAASLGMSVANVSRATQRFENNLGIRLFKGEGRRSELNDTSNEIIGYLSPLLVHITALRARLGDLELENSGADDQALANL